jgi:hypothetical protein
MAETFSPLSSGSCDSRRDDPLAENVPLNEYLNERFVSFQEVINQRLSNICLKD